MNHKKQLKAVDFFCGGGGMTCGLVQAGIKVLAGVDIDPECKATYEANNKGSKFIQADITKLTPQELIKETGIKKNDDNLIFIGCSPCQYWSVIRADKSKSEKTKNLLGDFQKFVEYFKPGFVLVENVPGILKRKNENALKDFLLFLEKNGYGKPDYGIVNMNEYGVPQNRKRFSLICSRVNQNIQLPKPDLNNTPKVQDFIGKHNNFPSVKAGYRDETSLQHTVARLSEKNLERLKITPENGGNRLAWKDKKNLQNRAYEGKDNIFRDTYSRMTWEKPAPTITTKFWSISNGRFAHPEEHRAISLREGATLQTFPKNYVFKANSIVSIARLIGNAVPPEFAKRIGLVIK